MASVRFFVFYINDDLDNVVFVEGYKKSIAQKMLYDYYGKADYKLYGEYDNEDFEKLNNVVGMMDGYHLENYIKYYYEKNVLGDVKEKMKER